MTMGYGGVFGKPRGGLGGLGQPFGFPQEDEYDLQRPMPQGAPATEEKQGGGFKRVAGIIGDALLASAGRQPIYTPMMMREKHHKRRLEQQQKLFEQQRQYGLQDYETKKQIDQRYAAPPAPDAFERTLIGAGINPRGPEGISLYQRRAEAMARDPNDEFVVVPLPDGRTYAGPKSGMETAFGGGGNSAVEAEMRRRGLM